MIRALGLALVVALAGVAWQVWPGSSTAAGPRVAEAQPPRVERATVPPPALRPTDVPVRAESQARVEQARPEPARPAPIVIDVEPVASRPAVVLPPPAPIPAPQPEPAPVTAFAPPPPEPPALPPAPSRQIAAAPAQPAVAPAPPQRTVVAARTVPDEEETTATDATAGGAIDLNSASLAELNALRGGGSIGRAIVRGRPYESPEDLLRKRILSRSTYDRIKDQIAVR